MRMASDTHDVEVTLREIMIGECPLGHKPGDSWIIKGNMTPGNMCVSAFQAVFPAVRYFQYGEGNPWRGGDDDITSRCCPDEKHVVIFDIKRLH